MKKAQKNVLFGIALLLISSSISNCEAVGLNVVNEGNQPPDTRNIDVVCYTWRYCVHFCDDRVQGFYTLEEFGQRDSGSKVPGLFDYYISETAKSPLWHIKCGIYRLLGDRYRVGGMADAWRVCTGLKVGPIPRSQLLHDERMWSFKGDIQG
nr:hypothetical protein Iba_chr09fCG12890 [Ipomoea batatas]